MATAHSWFRQLLEALMKKTRTTHEVRINPAPAKQDSMANLASGMADDFNNILTTVMGACSLIDREEHPSDELLQCVALIRTSAERAATLSDKLMRASNPPDQDPGRIVRMAQDSTSELASARDKRIIHDIVPSSKKPDGATS